jgi:glycosyltransferase involved in cell wall biosynthesis
MSARYDDGFTTQVVIDGLSARVGGGITDLVNLLPALVNEYPQLRLTIVLSSRYQTELIEDMVPEISVEPADLPPMPALRRLQFLRSELPRLVAERQAKVILCMGELVPPAPGCPVVALVRNPNVFATWGAFGPFKKEVRAFIRRTTARPFIKRLVTRADHLIFVSESFRDDVCRRYPMVYSKSSVAHLGFDPDFCDLPEDRFHLPPAGRYILSVSGVAPHKNHETLIAAFAKLVKQPGFQDLTLVIAGTLLQRGVHVKLLDLSRALRVDSQVVFTDRVPHSSLPAFYRKSLLHVLPSIFETFGHPYVEAMGCGAPVVASDIPVAREICGSAAEFFPTTDATSLESLMSTLIKDEERRSRMVARGRRRAQDFSWSRTASSVGLQLLKAAGQHA